CCACGWLCRRGGTGSSRCGTRGLGRRTGANGGESGNQQESLELTHHPLLLGRCAGKHGSGDAVRYWPGRLNDPDHGHDHPEMQEIIESEDTTEPYQRDGRVEERRIDRPRADIAEDDYGNHQYPEELLIERAETRRTHG